MKIENQVSTLEQSKRLKELGIDELSLFSWVRYDQYPATIIPMNFYSEDAPEYNPQDYMGTIHEEYAAFTVSELQAMDGSLGNIELSHGNLLEHLERGKFYSTTNVSADAWEERFSRYKTLAEAWADKVIRGLENGYYEAADCNERLKNS